MANIEDDFGALYGDVDEPEPAQNIHCQELDAAPDAAVPAAAEEDDDAALFLALYGGQAPPDEQKIKLEAPKVVQQAVAHAPREDAIQPAIQVEPAAAAAGEGSEDEDDLMITLDENATAYEPSANRYQYQRSAANAAPGAAAEAIGAAPGQHLDDSGAAAASIPGLGAFGTRAAIGGIPRSAIPGLAASFAATAPPSSAAPPGQSAAPPPYYAGPPGGPRPSARPPRPSYRLEDAVFPSQQRPGVGVKLPGQTRVSPEEYREFLALGHGELFELDIDAVVDPPWRYPGTDPSDFFNYGFTERTWKQYTDQIRQFRLEFTMKGQIQTLDQARFGGGGGGGGFGLPAGGGAAAGAEGGQGGNQVVQSSMADEHYEAFVTSERPPRQLFQRHGSSWDHTIVLAGHDLNFEAAEAEAARETAMAAAAASAGGAPPPPPRAPLSLPHALPRPPPPRPPPPRPAPPPPRRDAGAAEQPVVQQQQQQQQLQAGVKVEAAGGAPANGASMMSMALPPPFVGPGFGMPQGMMGGMMPMALPPPFKAGDGPPAGPSHRGGDFRRDSRDDYRREPPPQQPPPLRYGNGGGAPTDRFGGGAGLAVGMDIELPSQRAPPGPGPGRGFPERRAPGAPPPFDRSRGPPHRDFGAPPPREAAPFRGGGPPPFHPAPRQDFGEQVRQRMRAGSPPRERQQSPRRDKERDKERERSGRSDRDRGRDRGGGGGREREGDRKRPRSSERHRERSPQRRREESGRRDSGGARREREREAKR